MHTRKVYGTCTVGDCQRKTLYVCKTCDNHFCSAHGDAITDVCDDCRHWAGEDKLRMNPPTPLQED